MSTINGADKDEPNQDKVAAADEVKQTVDWSVGLCQCCSYVSPDKEKCVAIPVLCPQACCCPALLLGANTTLMTQEPPIYIGEEGGEGDCNSWLGVETYFKLGEQGSKECLNKCLLQSLCYILCAGLPVVSYAVHQQRKEIMRKYNMPPVSLCAAVVAACLYPCSLFQAHATLEKQQYVQQAPVFKTPETGFPAAGPLTRGMTSKAFRGSTQQSSSTAVTATAPVDTPPDQPQEMKRSGPVVRPAALQIPVEDFLTGGDMPAQGGAASSHPPSTHDSHHTIPAHPPATPSPAATPQSAHRRQAQAASTTTSYSSTTMPPPQHTEITSATTHSALYGWSQPGSIELSALSNPTSPMDPHNGSSRWESQRRDKPVWAQDIMGTSPLSSPSHSASNLRSLAGDAEGGMHGRKHSRTSSLGSNPPQPSTSQPRHTINPFAPSPATPSSPIDLVSSTHPPWQTYDPPPSSTTYRPTRAAPFPPIASTDSDLVLTGTSSVQHSSIQYPQPRHSSEEAKRSSRDLGREIGDLLGPSFTTQHSDPLPTQRASSQGYSKTSSFSAESGSLSQPLDYQTPSAPANLPSSDSLPQVSAGDAGAASSTAGASSAGGSTGGGSSLSSSLWPSSISLKPTALGRKNKRYENMMASIADS